MRHDPESEAARVWCRAALPRVSRTFALNIRVLPGSLRDAVGQAYLFCRIADTVEDSPHLDARERPLCLAAYRSLFPPRDAWRQGVRAWAARFAPLASAGPDHALCSDADRVFAAFAALAPEMQGPVVDCVREMTQGMQGFAARRAATPGGRLQLENMAELEEYCHYVAGTVGTMLCRLFAAASPSLGGERLARMQALAGRFGFAMQLTNIVKDVADDARRGTFYVPRAVAARHRLRPEEILEPERRPAARAVVRELVTLAAGALDAALAFTLVLPRRETRLRLFCLWPIFLAARTLRRVLEDERLFVLGGRIGRGEVRACLGRTTLAVWSNAALRRLYRQERLALGPGLVEA